MEKLKAGEDNDEIIDFEIKRDRHLAYAKVVQCIKKNYQKDSNPGITVISIDLQKTIATP